MTNTDAWKRLNAIMSGASVLEDDWARVAPPTGIYEPYMDWIYPFSQAALEAGKASPYAAASGKLSDMVTSGEECIERIKSVLDSAGAAIVTRNMETGSNRAGESQPLRSETGAFLSTWWAATKKYALNPIEGVKATFIGDKAYGSTGLAGEAGNAGGGLTPLILWGVAIVIAGIMLSSFASAYGTKAGSK